MEPKQEQQIQERYENRHVKHVFSVEERNVIGGELARAIAHARGMEAEFDQIKASYKAKAAAASASVEGLSTAIMNGFEMRNKRCRVVFRPKDKKKDFYPEDSKPGDLPVLTEDMTQDDFQTELIQAESKFDTKDNIVLFEAGEDKGSLVVGRLNDKWYSALRIRIGKNQLTQRLDSEQKSYKIRFDAISVAAKAAMNWLKETLGTDNAKGFAEKISAAIQPHAERAE